MLNYPSKEEKVRSKSVIDNINNKGQEQQTSNAQNSKCRTYYKKAGIKKRSEQKENEKKKTIYLLDFPTIQISPISKLSINQIARSIEETHPMINNISADLTRHIQQQSTSKVGSGSNTTKSYIDKIENLQKEMDDFKKKKIGKVHIQNGKLKLLEKVQCQLEKSYYNEKQFSFYNNKPPPISQSCENRLPSTTINNSSTKVKDIFLDGLHNESLSMSNNNAKEDSLASRLKLKIHTSILQNCLITDLPLLQNNIFSGIQPNSAEQSIQHSPHVNELFFTNINPKQYTKRKREDDSKKVNSINIIQKTTPLKQQYQRSRRSPFKQQNPEVQIKSSSPQALKQWRKSLMEGIVSQENLISSEVLNQDGNHEKEFKENSPRFQLQSAQVTISIPKQRDSANSTIDLDQIAINNLNKKIPNLRNSTYRNYSLTSERDKLPHKEDQTKKSLQQIEFEDFITSSLNIKSNLIQGRSRLSFKEEEEQSQGRYFTKVLRTSKINPKNVSSPFRCSKESIQLDKSLFLSNAIKIRSQSKQGNHYKQTPSGWPSLPAGNNSMQSQMQQLLQEQSIDSQDVILDDNSKNVSQFQELQNYGIDTYIDEKRHII